MRRLFSKLLDEPRDVVPAAINRWNVARLEASNRIDDVLGRGSDRRIVHIGIHRNGNVGDTLLFQCVRHLMRATLEPEEWRLESVWSLFDRDSAQRVNRTSSGIVVGGGGLFLCDSNPNQNSGWQWNATVDAVDALRVPLIVFAVGYNRFPGQADFAPIFREHLETVVRKSAFFGVRNHGSIDALSGYLPEELHSRLVLQPCPTTVLKYYYPNVPSPSFGSEKALALNIAFDRPEMRFGNREDEVRREVVEAMRRIVDRGWKLHLAVHVRQDERVCEWFAGSGVPHEVVRLTRAPADEALRFYARMRLTIGMRGHALMVPFGLGNPILSLGGHAKLAYFLQDIGHPEWTVPFDEAGLSDRLSEAVSDFEANEATVRDAVSSAQDRLWATTVANLETISRVSARQGDREASGG